MKLAPRLETKVMLDGKQGATKEKGTGAVGMKEEAAADAKLKESESVVTRLLRKDLKLLSSDEQQLLEGDGLCGHG